ncbi:MAG TPA: sulfotransferase [Iamia sp.]
MTSDLAVLRQRAMDRAKQLVPGDARVRIVRTRLAARIPTARWRSLPDVLILGGMRCGTSSLYKYLGYHPGIAPSLRKEVEYFTRSFSEGEGWYRAHFPVAARRRAHRRLTGRDLVSFEASPYYLLHPHAPERARALVPDARLIVMVRDPVERAFSHWQHMVRHGIEDLSFEDAVDAEEARLAPEWERLAEDPTYVSTIHYHCSYLARSRYAEQLERWLAHYPADRFLVVSSDAMYADVGATYARVLDFMGVPRWAPKTFENYSYLGADFGPATSTLDPGTRSRLDAVFAADQARLAALTDGMTRA